MADLYADGEIKFTKALGRIEEGKGIDDWLFGLVIYEIKGIDETQAIGVRGLMLQAVYSTKKASS